MFKTSPTGAPIDEPKIEEALGEQSRLIRDKQASEKSNSDTCWAPKSDEERNDHHQQDHNDRDLQAETNNQQSSTLIKRRKQKNPRKQSGNEQKFEGQMMSSSSSSLSDTGEGKSSLYILRAQAKSHTEQVQILLT